MGAFGIGFQQFHVAGQGAFFVLFEAGKEGFVFVVQAVAVVDEVCEGLKHFFAFVVRKRHFGEAGFQFGAFALVVAQALFVLAQVDEVAAVLAVVQEADVLDGEPYVEAYHEAGEAQPQEAFPAVAGREAEKFPVGGFFHLGVFLMQVGKQAGGLGAVGGTGLNEGVGTREGLFVGQHGLVGGDGAGGEAQEEEEGEEESCHGVRCINSV